MKQQAKPCIIAACVLALVVAAVCFAQPGFAFVFSWPLGLFGLDYPLVDTLGPFTPAIWISIVSVGAWLLAARFTESTKVIVTAQLVVVISYLAIGVCLSLTPVLTPWRIGEAMHNQITARNAGWPLQFRFRGSCHWPGVREFHR